MSFIAVIGFLYDSTVFPYSLCVSHAPVLLSSLSHFPCTSNVLLALLSNTAYSYCRRRFTNVPLVILPFFCRARLHSSRTHDSPAWLLTIFSFSYRTLRVLLSIIVILSILLVISVLFVFQLCLFWNLDQIYRFPRFSDSPTILLYTFVFLVLPTPGHLSNLQTLVVLFTLSWPSLYTQSFAFLLVLILYSWYSSFSCLLLT